MLRDAAHVVDSKAGWSFGEGQGSFFGDRAFYNGDWLKRAAAAKGGIFGNSAVEAMYPLAKITGNGETLDGSKHNYTHVRQGQSASGERLLVRDHVRR